MASITLTLYLVLLDSNRIDKSGIVNIMNANKSSAYSRLFKNSEQMSAIISSAYKYRFAQ